jgi:hypothetical protein
LNIETYKEFEEAIKNGDEEDFCLKEKLSVLFGGSFHGEHPRGG